MEKKQTAPEWKSKKWEKTLKSCGKKETRDTSEAAAAELSSEASEASSEAAELSSEASELSSEAPELRSAASELSSAASELSAGFLLVVTRPGFLTRWAKFRSHS